MHVPDEVNHTSKDKQKRRWRVSVLGTTGGLYMTRARWGIVVGTRRVWQGGRPIHPCPSSRGSRSSRGLKILRAGGLCRKKMSGFSVYWCVLHLRGLVAIICHVDEITDDECIHRNQIRKVAQT